MQNQISADTGDIEVIRPFINGSAKTGGKSNVTNNKTYYKEQTYIKVKTNGKWNKPIYKKLHYKGKLIT